MSFLGVEVGCDIVGACNCVAAYLSNRISVGSSSNVRSKLHKAKTVRLAAIILLARHENVLVPLALGVFVFGAPARLRHTGDLIMYCRTKCQRPIKPQALPAVEELKCYHRHLFVKSSGIFLGLRWTNFLHKMCRFTFSVIASSVSSSK